MLENYFSNINQIPDYLKTLIQFSADKLVWILIIVFILYIIYGVITAGFRTLKLAVFFIPITFLLSKLAQILIHTDRPFITGNFQPLIEQSKSNGFPSDATLIAVSISMLIFSESKILGIILSVLAVFIGLGSIFSGIHNPIDIFGALIIAIISMIISRILMKTLKV